MEYIPLFFKGASYTKIPFLIKMNGISTVKIKHERKHRRKFTVVILWGYYYLYFIHTPLLSIFSSINVYSTLLMRKNSKIINYLHWYLTKC